MKIFLGLLVVGLPLLSSADSVEPIDTVESYVNIRELPEVGAQVVGRLYKGIPLPLLEVVDGWNAVEMSDGATGFVSADWSQIIVVTGAAEEVVEVEEPADPEPVEVEEPTDPEPVEVEESVDPEPVEVEEPVDPEPVEIEESVEPELIDEPEVVEIEKPVQLAPIEEVAAAEVVDVVPVAESAVPLTIKGKRGFLVKFKEATFGSSSQIFDNGSQIGIGTTEPKQRLEVNGNIQIHAQNSSVAGLMITQSSGETGYIMHNRASTLTIGAGSVDRIASGQTAHRGIAKKTSKKFPLRKHLQCWRDWSQSGSTTRTTHRSRMLDS